MQATGCRHRRDVVPGVLPRVEDVLSGLGREARHRVPPRGQALLRAARDEIKAGRLELPNEIDMKVTFHDSCHAGRACGLYEPPRELLEAIPGTRTARDGAQPRGRALLRLGADPHRRDAGGAGHRAGCVCRRPWTRASRTSSRCVPAVSSSCGCAAETQLRRDGCTIWPPLAAKSLGVDLPESVACPAAGACSTR